ncbi:MAG: YfiR family protein [Marinilabiliaceae bacterium]|nr:YfiR family protein [Marinilabiliaceae bacterium]
MNKLLMLVLFAAIMTGANAQKERFKALFIYNFTKNIEWPPQVKSNHFIIGVVGNSDIAAELQTIAQTQKVGNQTIKVINGNSTDELEFCHLVFLSGNKTAQLPHLLTKLSGKQTLIITDGKNLAAKGSGISFVQDGDKLKFEICRRNIEKQGLKSSSALANLGIVVD